MFQTDERMLEDSRTLITINSTKDEIDRLVKNGTLNYVSDTNDMYLMTPEAKLGGELHRLLISDALGKVPYDLTFKGSLIIEKDLIVHGDNTILNVANMAIEDNIIEINKGETGDGITSIFAGVQINRGLKGNANLLFSEADQGFIFDVNGAINAWIYQNGNIKAATDMEASRDLIANRNIIGKGTLTLDGKATLKNHLQVDGFTSLNGVSVMNGDVTHTANTTVNTLNIEDGLVTLNSAYTSGTFPINNGLKINRGSRPAAVFRFNDTANKWEIGTEGSVVAFEDHTHPAEAIKYANPAYPLITDLQLAMDKLLYVAPQVTAMSNNVNTVEIGSTITSVTLNWSLNKNYILSQTLNQGVGSIDTTMRTYAFNGLNLTSDTTYTVTVADDQNTANRSTSVLFRHKRYWGTSASDTLTNAMILAMSSEFATSRAQSRVFDCTGGKYFFFAWPASFGTPTFKINGLTNTAFVKTSQSFTNASGNTTTFDIYRCQFLQNGSGINVDVS